MCINSDGVGALARQPTVTLLFLAPSPALVCHTILVPTHSPFSLFIQMGLRAIGHGAAKSNTMPLPTYYAGSKLT